MSELERIRMKLRHVDVSQLESEEDYRRVARRILPSLMQKSGERVGETGWNALQKSLRKIPGVKVNTSSSDKRRFMRECGQNLRRSMGLRERRNLEEQIVKELKARKSVADESTN